MTELVYVLNGSNLNMLGKREPHLYGTTTLARDPAAKRRRSPTQARTSRATSARPTAKATMVDWLQEAFERDAARHHQSGGLLVRVGAGAGCGQARSQRPLIEVHITNIHKRDETYRHSLISLAATGVICGLGANGYLLAMQSVAEALAPVARGIQPVSDGRSDVEVDGDGIVVAGSV